MNKHLSLEFAKHKTTTTRDVAYPGLRITVSDYPFDICKLFILFSFSVRNILAITWRDIGKGMGYARIFGFMSIRWKIWYLAGDLVLQRVINNHSLQGYLLSLEGTKLRLVDRASYVIAFPRTWIFIVLNSALCSAILTRTQV